MNLLEHYLKTLQEYENAPNLIGYCINTYSECPQKQISCLRIVQRIAAQNPFYQQRIDRFVDTIKKRYEPSEESGI